jgi:uncharacterized protein (TIRG00374 family)
MRLRGKLSAALGKKDPSDFKGATYSIMPLGPTVQSKQTLRKVLITLLGFAVSGVALYFVFRGNFDFKKLLSGMNRIRVIPLTLSVVFYWWGVIFIRAYLVQHLMRGVGHVTFRTAYRYICIGFLVNNILPLRMGEGARIGGIAKRSGISVAASAGGLVLERLLDLTMAAFIGVTAVNLAPIPSDVRFAIFASAGVLVLSLALLGLLAKRGLKETSSLRYGRLMKFIWNIIARFTAGFGGIGSMRNLAITVTLSMLIWAAAVGTLVLRLMAFDLPPSPSMALVLMAGISIGISVPSAPSGIGVYHWLAAQSLILMGMDTDTAFGFAFFCHFVDFASSSAWGAVCAVLEGVGWSDLKAKA